MKTISETEHARLPEGFLDEPCQRMGCLVSLPPADGLGLFVPLVSRERIADCAETQTPACGGKHVFEFIVTGWGLKRRLRIFNRRRRELKGSSSASPRFICSIQPP